MLFCQVFHSKIPRQVECLVGWFLGIALVVSAVYSVYTSYKEDSRPLNKAENIIYGTLSRVVWGLALAWVIYACNKGYGSKCLTCFPVIRKAAQFKSL